MIYGQAVTFGVSSGGGAPVIFGDGSDGVGLFSADTTWLAETQDTGMIVKNFESLTIPEGVTVSAGNRNCGMIIRVKGNCTIAGTLANRMSPKVILDSDGVDFSVYPASMLSGLAGDGGDGGNGVRAYYLGNTFNKRGYEGIGGTGMVGRFYGGGWSGGGGGGGSCTDYEFGGKGGDGGSVNDITTAIADNLLFVGGAGANFNSSGNNGSYGGGGSGANGNGNGTSTCVGGSGPGGEGKGFIASGTLYPAGGGAGNYGGGVIILLVGGNLTITGTIDCSGCNGGGSGTSSNLGGGGSGGGGGGGRIFICHKGTISNSGILNVNGGLAGDINTTYGTSVQLAATRGIDGTIGTTAVKTYEQYKKEDVA